MTGHGQYKQVSPPMTLLETLETGNHQLTNQPTKFHPHHLLESQTEKNDSTVSTFPVSAQSKRIILNFLLQHTALALHFPSIILRHRLSI